MSTAELRKQILSPQSLVPAFMLIPMLTIGYVCANTLNEIKSATEESLALQRRSWTYEMQKDYQNDLAERIPAAKGISIYDIRQRNINLTN